MSLLISRVSRQAADKHLLGTRIVTAVIFVWGLASVFIVAFQCGSTRPWDLTEAGHCKGLVRFLHSYGRSAPVLATPITNTHRLVSTLARHRDP